MPLGLQLREEYNDTSFLVFVVQDSKYRFAELWLDNPNATLVVVSRPKRDMAHISKRCNKIVSSSDSRVSVTFTLTKDQIKGNTCLEVG